MKEKQVKDLDYFDSLPYTITLERWDEPDKTYWVARVLELPHCLTDGGTPEEALAEMKEVKREWLEANLKLGNAIPGAHVQAVQRAVEVAHPALAAPGAGAARNA